MPSGSLYRIKLLNLKPLNLLDSLHGIFCAIFIEHARYTFSAKTFIKKNIEYTEGAESLLLKYIV